MEVSSTNGNPVLLAILAHPDDESFGMGGTLALYARRGVQVHLVCATRGEAGTVDAEHMQGHTSIAELRTAELQCAAQQLGLSGLYFLDYRDSGMPGSADNQHPAALVNAPEAQVAGRLVEYIRRLRPQVVVTFDPIGGYKHPDHIAIHKAAVRAFEQAGNLAFASELPPYQPAKLYYHVIPKGFLRFGVWLLRLMGRDPRRFGRNADIDLAVLVEEGNFPVHARIDYGSVSAQKDDASLCHTSQLGGAGLRRGPMRWVQAIFGLQDQFMRAYPPAPPGTRESDLFKGV
jgi:LmbE family N-acetylglucosaminyl deacetylase